MDEEIFVEKFVEEMKRKRKEKSLSLKKLEELTSVSASFIVRLENRQRKNPGLIVFLKISKALQIDFYSLLSQCEQ